MTKFYMAALIIIILLLGCAKDIIVKPPTTLKGAYNGRYTVITDYGSSSGGTTREQWIEWTFTDYKFYSKFDSTKPYIAVYFCDVSGNYSLTSNITFADTLVSPGVCNNADVPIGSFNLIRKAGEDGVPDSIFMEQLVETTKKTIVLEKNIE